MATRAAGYALAFDADESAPPSPPAPTRPSETPEVLWKQAMARSRGDARAAEALLYQSLRVARREGREDLLPALRGALAERAEHNRNYVRAIALRRAQAETSDVAVRVQARLCLVLLLVLTGEEMEARMALAEAGADAVLVGPEAVRRVQDVRLALAA